MMVKLLSAAALATATAITAIPASGVLTIDAGTQEALENSVAQPLEIHISSDAADDVAGGNIILIVSDPLGVDAPDITGFDVENGTIFAGEGLTVTDLDGVGGADLFPEAEVISVAITMINGTVAVGTDDLLLTFEVDTTGFTAGQSFDIFLSSTDFGPTELVGIASAPIETTLIDGSFTLRAVPEPTLLSFVGLAGLSLMRRRN